MKKCSVSSFSAWGLFTLAVALEIYAGYLFDSRLSEALAHKIASVFK